MDLRAQRKMYSLYQIPCLEKCLLFHNKRNTKIRSMMMEGSDNDEIDEYRKTMFM